jgi:hypothetical protein
MEAPPEGTHYNTPELAIAAVNAFAREHGYALSTRYSKRIKQGVLKTIWLCCDRGRQYDTRWQENHPTTTQETSTTTNRCQFGLSLRLQHNIIVHNHRLSIPSTHAVHHRLELSQKALIIDL